MEIHTEPSCLAEVSINKFVLTTTEMHRNFTHFRSARCSEECGGPRCSPPQHTCPTCILAVTPALQSTFSTCHGFTQVLSWLGLVSRLSGRCQPGTCHPAAQAGSKTSYLDPSHSL